MSVGLLALYMTVSPGQQFDPPTYEEDPRLLKLNEFFRERRAPISHLSRDFLIAADRNSLDWRLLPSISIVESSGGKAYKNNNIFGWDNADREFESIRDGIHFVASRLAESHLYKNKDLNGKLATYNPSPEYAPLVKAVMSRVGPRTLDHPRNPIRETRPYSSIRMPR